MIRRLLSLVFQPTLTEDEEIEHALARLYQKEQRSLFNRVVDHPVGFCLMFFGGIFAAIGAAELLCALLGVPFDPRIG
jgi:hypothetical protein